MIQILNNPERDQPWRLRITAKNNEILMVGESVTTKSDCFTQLEAVAKELGAEFPVVWRDGPEYVLMDGDQTLTPIEIYKEKQ